MPYQEQNAPLLVIVSNLRRYCREGQTGTLRIVDSNHQTAHIAIRNGEIVDLCYKTRNGFEAVDFLAGIKEARHAFYQEDVADTGRSLPPTPDMLALLGLPFAVLGISSPSVDGRTSPILNWSMEVLGSASGGMLAYQDLVQMLRYCVSERLTHAVFILSNQREWFEFVFEGGDIVDVVSANGYSDAALVAFNAVTHAKYSLLPRRCTRPSSGTARRGQRRSSEELLDRLASRRFESLYPAAEGTPLTGKQDPDAFDSSIRSTLGQRELPDTREHSTFEEILKELFERCRANESGLMVVVTRQRLLEIVLDSGRIVAVKYLRKSGLDAIQAASKITTGRFSFTSGYAFARQHAKTASNELPSNEEIFHLLGLSLETLGIHKSERTSQARDSAPTPRGWKILIVDDSALTRKVVSTILTANGYSVVEATNGLEALRRIEDEHPDLVLLDLIMPGMDGYKVLSTIRHGAEDVRHTPIILLTSRDKLLDKVKGRMTGSDEYLTKPFSPDELLDKIRKHLG